MSIKPPPGLPPATSAFNDGYVAEQFERYRSDPSSVDESWRQYFRVAERLLGSTAPADPGVASGGYSKLASARALIHAIRTYGHLAVPLDPLGSSPRGAEELTLEYHGLSEADLRGIPGASLGFPQMTTALDVVERLRFRYSTGIGYEYTHLSDSEEREWFRDVLRAQELTRPLTPDEKVAVLERLTQVDGLERFLGRSYVSAKRFSIEGTDALVPMLDLAIEESARDGARMLAIAMAHRGRLNVLTHILGKPYSRLFAEFEGRHAVGTSDSGTGDVKYHLGLRGRRKVGDHEIDLVLVPNPSHLEFVNAVLAGFARAEQCRDGDVEENSVVPVVVHGDAAFPGEGIVAETFNLSRLRGYRVGGTLHIIANNQVGFTTDPGDGRSTYYASDVAKGFEVPIMHVNADDAEACLTAVRVAVAYRTAFNKDVVIDLVGYRRHGHNEGDEPTYTQPELYARIKEHPTPRQVWAKRLVEEKVVTEEQVAEIERKTFAALEEAHKGTPRGEITHQDAPEESEKPAKQESQATESGVTKDKLAVLNERLLTWPSDFSPHPRLAKQLERRRDAMNGEASIDWGLAEALAFASLLTEGVPVRITGQDVERGTFSHRHAVLHDVKTGGKFVPLANLPQAAASFEIYNSPLSETAVLGFEYGYSVARPKALVLWEAQFGDFVNVAQPIIDQFLVADRAKWGQDSSLVLLLPHGYEGQGPEHSSARPERFLQLAAEGNLRLAYPSSPAQYFHILRRQATQEQRRPLILLQPKSLLRLPEAASTADDLVSHGFQPVIDDPRAGSRRDAVTRVVLCTGKVYYDIAAKGEVDHVAVVRMEQMYPWPQSELEAVMDQYPNVEEVLWVQEEPKNMGFWSFVQPRLRVSIGNAGVLRYVGRPERASPAEGFLDVHRVEQARIVDEALAAPSSKPSSGRRKAAARA
jgi:2-oxoglutarate dehydrogenase E1 component